MKHLSVCLLILCLVPGALLFAGAGAESGGAAATAQPAAGTAKPGDEHSELYTVAAWEKASSKKLAFSESPLMAAKVKAGEIPALEKRLPNREDVLVVKPSESVGKYGGTWRLTELGALSLQIYTEVDEGLFTSDYYLRAYWPNIVKDYKLSDDARTLTLYLRKGMKWSDGHPFTSADFAFFWNDVVNNPEITPIIDARWKSGGELAKFTVIDEYTVSWTFKNPYGLIVETLTLSYPPKPFLPAHYLKQFHPTYTKKEELDKKIADAKFKTWIELFNSKNDTNGANPERPCLGAFLPLDKRGSPLTRYVPNPYYFKVDTAGQQLPYLDGAQELLMGDAQAMLLKTLAGETDIQFLRVPTVANLPVLTMNATKGDYRLVFYPGPQQNHSTIYFNYLHPDPVLRELFLNKDFRIALSYGTDRKQVSDLNYRSLAEPMQVEFSPDYKDLFDPAAAKRYVDYKLDEANAMLDKIGLKWDAAKEWRVRSDGKRLQLEFKAYKEYPAENIANCELIAQQWKKMGIEVVVKPTQGSLWFEQMKAGDYMVSVYGGGYGFPSSPPYKSNSLFPLGDGTYSYWCEPWSIWVITGGKSGVEPPEDVKKALLRNKEIVDQIPSTASPEKRNAMYKEAAKNMSDLFLMIGVVIEPNVGRYFIFKNKVGNATEYGLAGFRNADFKFSYTWPTYYFKY